MNKRIILALILVLCGIGLYIGYYMYNKPMDKVESLKSDFSMSAKDLYNEFDANEDAATAKYQNKVIEVTGAVDTITTGETGNVIISLNTEGGMGSVSCELDKGSNPDLSRFQKGTATVIKGVCAGKLMDVVLNRCAVQ